MWCWRNGMAFAAATSAVAAATIVLPSLPGHAENYRINNVDHAQRIHMRETPSNRAKVVAYIVPNARLEGTGKCDDRWCEVIYKEHAGWVFRKYLLSEPNHASQPPAPPAEKEPAAAALPESAGNAAQATAEPDDKTLRLVFTDGRPIPVYAFPSNRLPAAGRLSPGTEQVEDLGNCSRHFCYIRSGSLVGWVPDNAVTKERKAAVSPQTQETAATVAPAPRDIDATMATATQTAGEAEGIIPPPDSIDTKSYSLAGLSGDASLPVREAPEDGARILGWIPGSAKNIEGLRKCVLKFCLVRYEALTGWVARRHLADESAATSRQYLVSGVALWGAVDVVDFPGSDAAVVGHIPAYATGIVPIGSCDRNWCHVRYLGIAGWVPGRYLALQNR